MVVPLPTGTAADVVRLVLQGLGGDGRSRRSRWATRSPCRAPSDPGDNPVVQHLLPTPAPAVRDDDAERCGRRAATSRPTGHRGRRPLAHRTPVAAPPRRVGIRPDAGAAPGPRRPGRDDDRRGGQRRLHAVHLHLTLTARDGTIPLTIDNTTGLPVHATIHLRSQKLDFPDGDTIPVVLTEATQRSTSRSDARRPGPFRSRSRSRPRTAARASPPVATRSARPRSPGSASCSRSARALPRGVVGPPLAPTRRSASSSPPTPPAATHRSTRPTLGSRPARPSTRETPAMAVRIVTDSAATSPARRSSGSASRSCRSPSASATRSSTDGTELSVEALLREAGRHPTTCPRRRRRRPGAFEAAFRAPAGGRRRRHRVHQPLLRPLRHHAVGPERGQGRRGRPRRPRRRLPLDHRRASAPRSLLAAEAAGGRRVRRRGRRPGRGPRHPHPGLRLPSTRSTTSRRAGASAGPRRCSAPCCRSSRSSTSAAAWSRRPGKPRTRSKALQVLRDKVAEQPAVEHLCVCTARRPTSTSSSTCWRRATPATTSGSASSARSSAPTAAPGSSASPSRSRVGRRTAAGRGRAP